MLEFSVTLAVNNFPGVSSQLWYVRNGAVNKYALGYVVVVPPQVDTLIFYWQALQGTTVRMTGLVFTNFSPVNVQSAEEV